MFATQRAPSSTSPAPIVLRLSSTTRLPSHVCLQGPPVFLQSVARKSSSNNPRPLITTYTVFLLPSFLLTSASSRGFAAVNAVFIRNMKS